MFVRVEEKKSSKEECKSHFASRNGIRERTSPKSNRKEGKLRTSVMSFAIEPMAAVGLAAALSGERDLQLVHTGSSPTDIGDALAKLRPQILLLDVMPEFTVSTLWQIREAAPDCRTVLWVRSVSTELAHQATEYGVRGILSKKEPVETLIACLRAVAQGAMWLEESLRASLGNVLAVHLSDREGQLVGLLSSGMSNKEIAERLRLSEGTVKVYMSRMFRKLGMNDRLELAMCGIRNFAGRGMQSAQGSRKGLGPHGLAPWLRSLVIQKPSLGLSTESEPPRHRMVAAVQRYSGNASRRGGLRRSA